MGSVNRCLRWGVVLIASPAILGNAWQHVFEVHICAENKEKGSELIQAEAKKVACFFPLFDLKTQCSSRVNCLC